MPELILKLGEQVLQTYVFDKDITSIGRSRDNDVVIENLSVSRNHARIRRQNGKYILTDLNSANGTYVNGVRVSKTEIFDNDVISIGKHKMHFMNKTISDEEMIAEAFSADRTVLVERAPMQGVLCVTDGKLKGQEFPLTKIETAIGKASSNDIVLGDDWFLSKKQAIVTRHGSDYEIQDLGGFRKIKVNGASVTEPVKLKDGDKVEIGNTRMIFKLVNEYAVQKPTGRMPQELGLEDSVFSSGGMDGTPLAPSTHAGESEAAAASAPPPGKQSAVIIELSGALDEDAEGKKAETARASTHRSSTADFGSAHFTPGQRVLEDIVIKPQQGVAASGAAAAEAAELAEPEPQPPPEIPVVPANTGEAIQAAFDSQEDAPTPPPEDVPETHEEPAQPAAQAPPPAHEPAAEAPAAATAEAQGGPVGEELAKEIATWEAALQNKSQVIRKQAARMLKKLTGKDYAY